MKKTGILICGLLLSISCAEERDLKNIVFDPFQDYDEIKSQIFNLEIGLKEIRN